MRAHGPGPRTEEALEWVARLDVAGLEAVGQALGMSRPVLYSHASRAASVGWLTRLYDRDGSVVAVTREGRRRTGQAGAGARAGQLALTGRAHLRAVSWMAALQTIRGREWFSERELRDRPEWLVPVLWTGGEQGLHRPDLGAIVNGHRMALEIELSHKAPRRLRAIMAGYEHAISTGQFAGGVIYVSDRPDVLAAAGRAASAAGVPRDRFAVRALDDLYATVRDERAAQADAVPGCPDGPARGGR